MDNAGDAVDVMALAMSLQARAGEPAKPRRNKHKVVPIRLCLRSLIHLWICELALIKRGLVIRRLVVLEVMCKRGQPSSYMNLIKTCSKNQRMMDA